MHTRISNHVFVKSNAENQLIRFIIAYLA